MIFTESRYETALIMSVADSDGIYRATIIPRRTVAPAGDYTMHRVVYGDRLDRLAFLAYGDPEFWWRIADANPDLAYPDKLVPGTLLKIPRTAVDV